MGRKTSRSIQTPPTRSRKFPPPCYFLQLPGEIKNSIFEYILTQHHDQSTTLSLLSDLSDPNVYRPSPQQPALARTCHQLRHEVLSIFYGGRTFDVDRELGTQDLVETLSRIMRPALSYLRSIRFELFSEYSAGSKDLEGALCNVITVHAWLTDDNTIDFRVESDDTCTCKFVRCARDVERGILGSSEDAPLIRFLKAWDIAAPPVRGDRFMVCSGCGAGNMQVSLRDIRRRASLSSL